MEEPSFKDPLLDTLSADPPLGKDGRRRWPLGAIVFKPRQRKHLPPSARGDLDTRTQALGEPGHPGQNRGTGLARQSVTKERQSLKVMVQQVDALFDQIGIKRYKATNGQHVLVSPNTSGTLVEGRWDLDELEILAKLGVLEHIPTLSPDRVMRNSKAAMLRWVGTMADHRIKIHDTERSYNLGLREHRKIFIDKMFEAEAALERIFLTHTRGKIGIVEAGGYPHGAPPYGAKIVRRRKANATLVLVAAYVTKIRRAWAELLARSPTTYEAFVAFARWAANVLGLPYKGRATQERIQTILTDPTYVGHYHVFRRWFSPYLSHMDITRAIDVARVHALVARWLTVSPRVGDPRWTGRFGIEEVARLAGAHVEELTANENLLLVCRRPLCFPAQLRRIRDGLPAVMRNGGFVDGDGTFYQAYSCTRCRKPVFLGTRAQGRSILGGYRCGVCQTPDHWTIGLMPRFRHESGWLVSRQVFKITCRGCGDVQYKPTKPWGSRSPFRSTMEAERQRRPSQTGGATCIHHVRRWCNGRCDRAHALYRRKSPDADISEALHCTPKWVRRWRLANRFKAHVPRKPLSFAPSVVREMAKLGANDSKIARALGVKPNVIFELRKRENIPARPKSPVLVSPASVHRLWREGLADDQIARRLVCPVKTVRGIRRSLRLASNRARRWWRPQDERLAKRLLHHLCAEDVHRALRLPRGVVKEWNAEIVAARLARDERPPKGGTANARPRARPS